MKENLIEPINATEVEFKIMKEGSKRVAILIDNGPENSQVNYRLLPKISAGFVILIIVGSSGKSDHFSSTRVECCTFFEQKKYQTLLLTFKLMKISDRSHIG